MSLSTLRSKQAIALLVISVANEKRKTRKKRVWMKNWLKERTNMSDVHLLKELKVHYPDDYQYYLRMNDETFSYILSKVKPLIERQNTKFRDAITAEEKLVVTLRYLATGRTLQDLKFSSKISPQSLSKIIPETCKAVYEVLKEEFLKMPSTPTEWKAVAAGFQDLWQFPNCGGAIDGKHVAIVKPAKSGSYYYNYKGYHSIVLMAAVNANLEFLFVDVGQNGRNSDGGVIDNTLFYQKLKLGQLGLPTQEETVSKLNFVFLGDEAFALREDFLKPFPRHELSHEKKIFNYRLSRARRVVENAFGILASKFRIFHSAITLSPEKADYIVLACVVLHNLMRKRCGRNYIPPNLIDQEDIVTGRIIHGEWRQTVNEDNGFQSLCKTNARHASEKSKNVRDAYVKYFITEGKVAWQDNMTD